MQNYASHIFTGVTGGDFRSYQKQAQPVAEAIDFSTGEIRLEEPDWLVDVLLNGARSAPLGYIDIQGLSELRSLYANYLHKQGYQLSEKNILVTTGAKEAIWLALLANLKPGATLLLPRPGWPPYQMWGQAFEAVTVFYDLLPAAPAETLIAAMERYRPAVAVINFPHNPTGLEISQVELQRVLEVAAALNITLISDEVYRTFSLIEQPGTVLKAIGADMSGVIFVDSVTKMLGLAGLRVGFLVADPSTVKRLGIVRSSIASCVSSFAQAALVGLFQDQRCRQWMQLIIDKSHECKRSALHHLQEAGYEVESSGAIYIWARRKPIFEEEEDQIVMNGQILQVVSGRTFSTPSYFRLCPVRTSATLEIAFGREHALLRSAS